MQADNSRNSGDILSTTLGFGVFFFIAMILSMITSAIHRSLEKTPKSPGPRLSKVLLTTLLVLISCTAFGGYKLLSVMNSKVVAVASPAPVPTAPSASPATVKGVKTTNNIPSDPIVVCNVNPNCGGGTKELRKSVCSNSTCCQIGNSWYFYEDTNKCKQDQEAQKTKYVSCELSYGTFNLTEADCQMWKAKNTQTVLDYPSTNTNPVVSTTPSPNYDSINDYNKSYRDQCIAQVRLTCSAKEQELLRLIAYGADVDRNKEKLAALKTQCLSQQQGCYSKYPEY
jgi:hypothetical protein